MFNNNLSRFFLVLLAVTAVSFLVWGGGYVGSGTMLLFVIATAFGLFMAFNIGGNDVANSFGTSVGAGTLTITQALVVAAIFEVSGAMIAGGAVTDTIRKGIVDLDTLTGSADFQPVDFVYIMMSALLAAASWLLIATRRGWPVSTTHSIVGGIVGSSVALGVIAGTGGEGLVQWSQIATIATSWVISPVLGGLCSYIAYTQIKKNILSYNDAAKERLAQIRERRREVKAAHANAFERMTELQKIAYTTNIARDAEQAQSDENSVPEDFDSTYYREMRALERDREAVKAHHALINYVPLLAAIGSMVITAMLLFKGLKNVDLTLSALENGLVILMVAALVWMSVYIFARTLKDSSLDHSTFLLFSWMQVFTAAGFAFSHGSNDIANAIGPFAAILDVLHSGEVNSQAPVPPAAMLAFGIAMVAGLWFIGREVIQTIGTELTRMHPASGFTAELSAAAIVLLASGFGIPVSSTHILVGAVLGIGLANRSTNWDLMKPIGAAWVITLPAAAAISALTFIVLRSVL